MSHKPMRVLQVGKYYPPYRGGIEDHLQKLCRDLQRHVGLQVVVANANRETVRDTCEEVEVLRLGTVLKAAGAPITPGLTRIIRESEADIVHIHLPHPTALLSYLLSGHRGRLVLSYHSDIVRQRFLLPLVQPLINAALRRASAIIAASPAVAGKSPVLRPYRNKCHVIPYGIDLPNGAASKDLVEKIRPRHGQPLVLAVGRLVYYKGFQHLIEAMRNVDAHLVIVGDGPLRSQLEQQAAALKGKAILAGEVEDVAPYYEAADIFVLPSVEPSEAFGIVQLEAMARGKPVINTDLETGVPFVSLHEVTGITVPPGDSTALAGAINLLLGDDELRHRYGHAARQRVQENFMANTTASSILKLYRESLD